MLAEMRIRAVSSCAFSAIFTACALLIAFPFSSFAGWNHSSVGSIVYSVFTPADYSTSVEYPVVMILHGAGASGTDHANTNEQDAQILSSSESQTDYPCIIYTPQAPPYDLGDHWVNPPDLWQYGNYSVTEGDPRYIPMSACLKDALDGLDQVCSEYSVDTNRIYLGGGSMGGYGTWDILCRGYSNKFACAVPVGGAADVSKAADLKDFPIWAFVCESDGIINPAYASAMVDAIQNENGIAQITTFTSNDIDNAAGYVHYAYHLYILPFVVEPDLKAWMFDQNRNGTSIRIQKPMLAASLQNGNKSVKKLMFSGHMSNLLIIKVASGTSSAVFDAQGHLIGKGESLR